jgi:transcriptional regulator with PAS, ATPase and Fis domain
MTFESQHLFGITEVIFVCRREVIEACREEEVDWSYAFENFEINVMWDAFDVYTVRVYKRCDSVTDWSNCIYQQGFILNEKEIKMEGVSKTMIQTLLENKRKEDQMEQNHVVAVDATPTVVAPPTVTQEPFHPAGYVSVFSERQDEPSLAEMFSILLDMVERIGEKVVALENKPQVIDEAKIISMVEKIIEDTLEDEVDSRVDMYMTHHFDLEDHVDMEQCVRDELDNMLEDKIEEKVKDLLDNASISIDV